MRVSKNSASFAVSLIFLSLISHPLAAEIIRMTYSSGTGFFVDRDGMVLTNNHVIKECKDITVSGPVALSDATLVARDVEHDLALLKANAMPTDVAQISTAKQPLKEGEPVVVIGFPGQAWQTGEPVVREAQIVHTKGPRGEEKWIEFSDSVQQGNSGGPLLDGSGNVVGVVVAKGKLITYNVAGAREETVENFDMAISLPVVREFLESNSVRYREADSGIYLSSGRIASDARRFIVNVRCRVE